jgi:glucose-6-phosphate isomerase
MIYTHDITPALAQADSSLFEQTLANTTAAIETLRRKKADNTLPVLNVPERSDDWDAIETTAARITERFRTLLVIGMGASSLGGKTLCALTDNPYALDSKRTLVHFVENIDPFEADRMLASLDLASTCFFIVSKSGDTAETAAHMLVLMDAVSAKLGKAALKDHFIFLTMPGDRALRRIGDAHGITVLDHAPHIGGRFSGLTNVGLLPAKVAGVDIRAVRKGARDITHHMFSNTHPEPAKGAAMHAALLAKGKTVSVLMPYCDRLQAFGGWYRQLWAESLGKGGHGTTPVRSQGAADQHSQLQLYLDGPRDKFMTLVCLEHAGKGPRMKEAGDDALHYLSNHTMGDLLQAEQDATLQTLIRNRCPVRTFHLKALNAEALGALMMHFMLETMVMAELLGINAFDQPAVEEGKILARQALGAGK